jgi:hypothetical protein
VAFADDQDPVQQLTAVGPIDALADGIHPRQSRPLCVTTSRAGPEPAQGII